MPDPEQLEHLSVFGGDKGWSLPLTEVIGSIRTSDPVLEHRAHARYPGKKNIWTLELSNFSAINFTIHQAVTSISASLTLNNETL